MQNALTVIYKFLISLSQWRFVGVMICFVLALLGIVFVFYCIGRKIGQLEILRHQDKLLKVERADAIKRSRAVINGQLCEQVAPFLPDFPCSAEDVRFIGKPIDFVGFVGMNDNSQTDNALKEILFIEVKSGNSQLSEREKQIKDAIEKKRVRYVEYRI